MRDLFLNILPDGFLSLEWTDTEEEISKSRIAILEDLFSHYQNNYNQFLLYLGFTDPVMALTEGLDYFRSFSHFFTQKLALTPDLESIRENTPLMIGESDIKLFLARAPFIPGIEFLTTDILKEIWSVLSGEYQQEIRSFHGSVEEWLQSYTRNIHIAGRIYFHIVESKNEEAPFAFLATYTSGLSNDGKAQHIPLKNALSEYGKDSSKLLGLISTVHNAAKESELIREFLDSGEIFHPLSLSAKEALVMLREIPLYEKSGILCRIPNWWKNKTGGMRLSVKAGSRGPSFVGMDAILDFDAELLMGDEKISVKEAKALLNNSDGLAFIKGKWVEVDPEKLKETLSAYEKALSYAKQGLTLKEAIRLQFENGKEFGVSKEDEFTITNGEWLESTLRKLIQPELIRSASPGKDFKAILRPYQEKGLNWLSFLNTLRFGACLADDMGLGKTVQLLAFLNSLKDSPDKQPASLLVLPASLIANWVSELEKFAPLLRYYIAHPSFSRTKETDLSEGHINQYDLVITTYSFAARYEEKLACYTWNCLILDEAQAIKNPGTKQTIACKKIPSKNRVIMTGTPVENRLEDLWSLFDFVNPGLLGSGAEFSKFSKSLKENPDGYSRLKKIISPFILRRLKTDKSIITDLPDKIEMKCYSELSKKQIVLYEKQVKELQLALESTEEGIAKKGLVLSSLMKFKQLCNHPDQFLGQNGYSIEDSGKFQKLQEICETIYAKRERVLVFTQFAEITGYLDLFLEKVFHHKGTVLHGGVPVAKRKDIVERFQGHEYIPYMVLSLKAGGVGLNLTQASHVIHFDRWWNPAVENQATDRAFRIGQKNTVIVHKFITKGTIEEKIDAMIEDKNSISREVIGETGEGWITEMDNKKLMEMFTLTLGRF